MMQAGKNYIAKADAEYESPRAAHLRELLHSVKAQDAAPEEKDLIPIEPEPVKSTNQDKPTLKLTK